MKGGSISVSANFKASHRQKLNWTDEETFFLVTFINERKEIIKESSVRKEANCREKGKHRQHQRSAMVYLSIYLGRFPQFGG